MAGVLFGSVFLIFCGIDFYKNPKPVDKTLEFIALNEIPGIRIVVVIGLLSLLSLVEGIASAKQIDMTFLTLSVLLLGLADILGKNEF